jgi:hypothetical protein
MILFYYYLKNRVKLFSKRTLFEDYSKNKISVVCFQKKCIFAPLINGGRVPQNLITRLCQ